LLKNHTTGLPAATAALLIVIPCLFAWGAVEAQVLAAPEPVRVRFQTSKGNFALELDAARAPLSVANFVQYVRDKYYDGTIFHRVIGNFMVQAGGYTAEGVQKLTRPGVPNESGNGLSNRRGTVAMARTDDPHSATSQFYINVADNLALDPAPTRWGYAVFGRVIDGMDVVDKIASAATGARGKFEEDTPLEPILIVSAELEQAPAAAQ
jgi:cyclophilin family peptidyl-prolyl cis-trans isomerase